MIFEKTELRIKGADGRGTLQGAGAAGASVWRAASCVATAEVRDISLREALQPKPRTRPGRERRVPKRVRWPEQPGARLWCCSPTAVQRAAVQRASAERDRGRRTSDHSAAPPSRPDNTSGQ